MFIRVSLVMLVYCFDLSHLRIAVILVNYSDQLRFTARVIRSGYIPQSGEFSLSHLGYILSFTVMGPLLSTGPNEAMTSPFITCYGPVMDYWPVMGSYRPASKRASNWPMIMGPSTFTCVGENLWVEEPGRNKLKELKGSVRGFKYKDVASTDSPFLECKAYFGTTF